MMFTSTWTLVRTIYICKGSVIAKYIDMGTALTFVLLVSTVGGLHRLPPKGQDLSQASSHREMKQSEAEVHLGVTPAILRARYNLTAADVGTAQNNSQAVAQV